jgi:hypothetical protein
MSSWHVTGWNVVYCRSNVSTRTPCSWSSLVRTFFFSFLCCFFVVVIYLMSITNKLGILCWLTGFLIHKILLALSAVSVIVIVVIIVCFPSGDTWVCVIYNFSLTNVRTNFPRVVLEDREICGNVPCCVHWCSVNVVGHALCRVFDITPVAGRTLHTIVCYSICYCCVMWHANCVDCWIVLLQCIITMKYSRS